MSQIDGTEDFYAAGRRISEYIAYLDGKVISTASLQALIRDLLPQHQDVQEALRNIVARPGFVELLNNIGSEKEVSLKCVFIESLKQIYSTEAVAASYSLLCGMMGHGMTDSQKESEAEEVSAETNSQQSIGNGSISPSLSMIREQVESSHVSRKHLYFNKALEISKRLGGSNLESASMNTSGKGLVNYVLRDSNGDSLARVPLAMIDASLRLALSAKYNLQKSADQSNTASDSSQIFIKALELARRMGNGSLPEASVATSSKGVFNYRIRDAMSRTLAKVPLSMLHNTMK